MFWNSEQQRDFGAMCRIGDRGPDDAMIKFDRDYTAAPAIGDEHLCRASLSELAEEAGFEGDLSKVVSTGLRNWRNSPSRSTLNLISETTAAVPGAPMFRSLREQQRFLMASMIDGVFFPYQFKAIPDHSKMQGRIRPPALKIGSFTAVTVDEGSEKLVNRLAHALHLWESRNKAMIRTGRIKLPPMLYRGVRANDVGLKMQSGSDQKTYNQRACDYLAATSERITTAPVVEWAHSAVLSFTTNETVAEMFTKAGGLVISIEPTAGMVFSSHKTDEALDLVDPITRKHEREWIIRLPQNTVLSPENVRAHSFEWFIAHGDFRAVSCLDTHAEAQYRIGEHEISARWRWNSGGKGGKVVYSLEGSCTETRADFKKLHGFDPLPEASDTVQSLKFFKVHNAYTGRRTLEEVPAYDIDLINNLEDTMRRVAI